MASVFVGSGPVANRQSSVRVMVSGLTGATGSFSLGFPITIKSIKLREIIFPIQTYGNIYLTLTVPGATAFNAYSPSYNGFIPTFLVGNTIDSNETYGVFPQYDDHQSIDFIPPFTLAQGIPINYYVTNLAGSAIGLTGSQSINFLLELYTSQEQGATSQAPDQFNSIRN